MRHVLYLLALLPTLAHAWGNHSPMCYRAFEHMPEVANAAAVQIEPLGDFLREQEGAIARELEAQEAWARKFLKHHASTVTTSTCSTTTPITRPTALAPSLSQPGGRHRLAGAVPHGLLSPGAIFSTMAPSFARTFTELRVQQYGGMAQLAWRTDHAYWGWRFAGLALHHVQDLTQPYHASAAPGASLGRMMWVNLKA